MATLHNRYELSDGLTNEERAVKNCTVTQLFEPEPPTAFECAKINAQHKLAPKAKRKVLLKSYAGGVIDVYREDNETYVDTLYEDMDTETLPFARFLERHAFKDDLHKTQRMADLAARHELLRPPAGKVIRNRMKARQARQINKVEGVRAAALLTAITALSLGNCSYPGEGPGSTTTHANRGAPAVPSQYSWPRPGMFPSQGTQPPPPGGRPARPAGPGLPSGGESADYD